MRDVAQGFDDDLFRFLDRLRSGVLQREAAKRKRDTGADLRATHARAFERAAAEVADNAVGMMNAGNYAQGRQLRLPRAGKHADLRAADAFRGSDKGAA